MAHGLVRIGEGRILPRARRHPFGIGGSGGGGDPGGGYSPPPSNGGVILEDFEDGDISDYTGDNSLDTHWTIDTTDPYEGTKCLESREDVFAFMYKAAPTVQRTDWLHCWIRNPAEVPTLFTWMSFAFAVQDALNYYLACVKYEGPTLDLDKYVDGEKVNLGSVGFVWTPEIWKRLEVLWGSVGDIEVRFAGVNITETDTTYEDGGWGWIAHCGEGDPVARFDFLRQNVDYVE